MTAPRLFVLTGAGFSADSGVATFRGGGGLWEEHRLEDVATPEAWERDPELVWRFYQMRRRALATAEPNAAHAALARLAGELEARGGSCVIVTQNVDDLHERAGSAPLHMHGELAVLRCTRCGTTLRDTDRTDPEVFVPCERCGHERMRPDVVWFGEIPYYLDEIGRALFGCTRFWALGTSGNVYPAAGFLAEARARGVPTLVQSLEPPENLSPRDEYRQGRAAEVVPALVDELLAGGA